jgi:hypothetical protein
MTCPPATPFLPTGPGRAIAGLRGALACLRVREALIGAWLVLAATAIVHADDRLQDWIPGVLALPDDAEVVTDRAVGSTVRMFSIATGADIDRLFADWEESLSANGYPVTQGTDDLLDRSIEFSGPGIANAKIIVAPTSEDGRRVIEFDATLE